MIACPRCDETERIVHIWRTDMSTLRLIDDFKCLACGARWLEETEAINYEEVP